MSDDTTPVSATPVSGQLPVFWSPNHQILYANAFQVRFTDVDFTFDVATQQNVMGQNGLWSTAQVVMPLKNAKMLALVLTEAFRLYEQKFGPIALPKEKVESLLATISAAVEAMQSLGPIYDDGHKGKDAKKPK